MNHEQSVRRNVGLLLSGVGLACRAETPEWRSEHLNDVFEHCFNWWSEVTETANDRDTFRQLTSSNFAKTEDEDWLAVRLSVEVARVALAACSMGRDTVADTLVEVASTVTVWSNFIEWLDRIEGESA